MAEQTTTKDSKIPKTDGNPVIDKAQNVFREMGDQVEKFATKTISSVKNTIDKALKSRNIVLTIRVSDTTNKKLSMLVDSGFFKSRSESAAYLIEEGIKHQDPLFSKLEKKIEKIEKLKDELKHIISEEISPKTE
jgi:hypothetical protein